MKCWVWGWDWGVALVLVRCGTFYHSTEELFVWCIMLVLLVHQILDCVSYCSYALFLGKAPKST